MEWLLFVVPTVLLAAYFIMVYNKLVTLANRYKNAFSQIEVQLKRRYDLIPNLINTAKGYLKHERETLEAVVNARNKAEEALSSAQGNPGDAGKIQALSDAEGALGGLMGRFNMLVEAYPDLKASQNMQQLTEELSSTENRIAYARQAFNDGVMFYNTYRQSFPVNVVSGMFGHASDASLLEFEDSEAIQKAPEVKF